ncbi:hypothetical protein J2X67_005461 [Variovorax sp. 3319]|nr:hypothetical protein [Variovorax sp. 3319]
MRHSGQRRLFGRRRHVQAPGGCFQPGTWTVGYNSVVVPHRPPARLMASSQELAWCRTFAGCWRSVGRRMRFAGGGSDAVDALQSDHCGARAPEGTGDSPWRLSCPETRSTARSIAWSNTCPHNRGEAITARSYAEAIRRWQNDVRFLVIYLQKTINRNILGDGLRFRARTNLTRFPGALTTAARANWPSMACPR